MGHGLGTRGSLARSQPEECDSPMVHQIKSVTGYEPDETAGLLHSSMTGFDSLVTHQYQQANLVIVVDTNR